MTARRLLVKGQTVGSFIFLADAGKRGPNRLCRFRCKCGNEHVMELHSAVTGRIRTCGCERSALMSAVGKANIKHGKTRTPEYAIWSSMKKRCLRPENKDFARYGGRGIKICDRWLSAFENFYSDMGLKPKLSSSIDRIDINGDYEPSNCRWATKKEQGNNRRDNVFIEYDGKRMTMAQWADHLHIGRSTVRLRLKRGWPLSKVLTTALFDRYGNVAGSSGARAQSLSRWR